MRTRSFHDYGAACRVVEGTICTGAPRKEQRREGEGGTEEEDVEGRKEGRALGGW